MIFHIPSSKHRARPLRFGLWWNRKSFQWKVRFTDSCRYDLQTDDQFDTNKLCGIGFIPGFHHKDSARFGWRYITDTGQVEIMSYCYINGNRIIQHLAFCEIGKDYDLYLKVLSSCYYMAIHDHGKVPTIGFTWIDHRHHKKLGYRLGIYFGGQATAPQEIKIELEKS